MNKRQKIVQQQFLDNEEAVLKRLKQVYGESLKTIDGRIEKLMKRFDPETGDLPQSAVYQLKYQKMLKGQVEDILNKLQTNQFTNVAEYLDTCYEDGFIGTMFDLQGQGVPMCFPLDQEAMVRAVQLDSKISQGLYTRLGEDVTMLKKKITAQVSRGIATGMSFQQVAKQLAGYTNIGYNRAVRIARTEGHRIQVQSTMDACYEAADKGADVVKQWNAALDARTRESHAMVDGEIRELDEKFSNGLMFPGDPSGKAAEVINCRCALNQRARWAMGEAELEKLKKRAEYFGLDKADTFDDYKKKYLKADETEQISIFKSAAEMSASPVEMWMNMTSEQQQAFMAGGFDINDVFEQLHDKNKTVSEWKVANPGGANDFKIALDFEKKDVQLKSVASSRGEGWMASADSFGTININEDGLGDNWKDILAHEAGHQMANMSSKLQNVIIDNPGNVLGRYNIKNGYFDGLFGEYNPEEAFATAVSVYYNNPDELKKRYPEAFDAIDGLFESSNGAKGFIDRIIRRYGEKH